MDREMKQRLQAFLNSSDDDKYAAIGNAYRKLLPKLKQFDPKNNGLFLLATILSTAAAADGKLAEKELLTIITIFQIESINLSEEQVRALVAGSSDKSAYEFVKELIKVLDAEEKAALLVLVTAVSAIDDTIESHELKYIDDLLNGI